MPCSPSALRTFLILTVIGFSTWANLAWSKALTTPSDVVERWLTNYPVNLELAAEFTTLAMRHFKPTDEWVQQMQAALMDVHLHYLQHKVLTQEIHGKRAVVIVEALISTIVGTQYQKEEYVLLQINDKWLINQITVTEERFLGNVM